MSRSFVKTKLRSMASIVAEVTWLIGLYKELGVRIETLVLLHYDNKDPIQIDIDCYFVKDKIIQCIIKTYYVSTKEHHANLLTKRLVGNNISTL